MRLLRRGLTVVAATVSAVLLLSTPAAANPGPPPTSMASLGDSITRGFNACGFYFDCVDRSFSTGGAATVASHYVRIRTRSPGITGRAYNDARSGAKAADMPGQADRAVSQRVEYVTLLIGANDACTASEATMTSVPAFRASIDATLGKLRAGLPGARVAVVSIPDLKRLWAAGKDNSSARSTWSTFRICQSMLANPSSTTAADEARRNRVRQRVADYNAQLAAACAAYGANCRFDGNAVFSYPFSLAQVSTWDYFHPNSSGQQVLADISYRATFAW